MARRSTTPGARPANQIFEPVTVGDLIGRGLKMTIHCRACGHFVEAEPVGMKLAPGRPVPQLDGAFKCSVCGSRDSCAMPLYPRRLPG
jgi:transcription elongation factor Elf1